MYRVMMKQILKRQNYQAARINYMTIDLPQAVSVAAFHQTTGHGYLSLDIQVIHKEPPLQSVDNH